MLPGDGVDTNVFSNTLTKVVSVWDFSRTWGWDGVKAENPGFPQNGNWSVKSEKFLPMQ